MELEKSFLSLSLQLWILVVWTSLLIMGKPAKDNLVITLNQVSTPSPASRRFGPQFWGQSEKHIQLCDHVCSNDPSEGSKYCNCSPESSMTITNSESKKQQLTQPLTLQPQQAQNSYQQLGSLTIDHQHSSINNNENQPTIQMPEVNYLDANEVPQMCDYLCTESPNDAIKYCNCQNQNNIITDNNGITIDNSVASNNLGNNFANQPPVNQVMASSEQVISEPNQQQQQQQQQLQSQLTIADYLRFDPSAERQLCSYLCTDTSVKLGNNNQFCNCKTKKVNQQQPLTINNQHAKKSQLISELGKSNLSSNPLAIKNILDAAVDSNHRKELCSYVCALEPSEAANNQCNCNQNVNNQKEPGKTPRTRFHLNPWRSIKKWFG